MTGLDTASLLLPTILRQTEHRGKRCQCSACHYGAKMATSLMSPAAEAVRPCEGPTELASVKQVSLRGGNLSPTSSSSHYSSPANEEFRFPAAPTTTASAPHGNSALQQHARSEGRVDSASIGSSPAGWVLCSEESTPPAFLSEETAHLKSEESSGLTQCLKSTTSSGSEDVDTEFSAALALSYGGARVSHDGDFFQKDPTLASTIDTADIKNLQDVQNATTNPQSHYSPSVHADVSRSSITGRAAKPNPARLLQSDAADNQPPQRRYQQQTRRAEQQQRQLPQYQAGENATAKVPYEEKSHYGNISEDHGRKKDVGGIFGRPVPSRRCQWLRALPVVFLMVLVAYILAVFITYHILPALQLNVPDYLKKVSMYNRGLTELVFTGITTFLFLVAYWLSVITPPGSIPNTPEWQASAATSSGLDKGAAALETKKTGERRHCKWCRMLKPDRAHHCRVCRACVLKMDHHCPWIYNCVGYKNHKYFLLSLIYGSLASLIIACCMLPSVREASDSEKTAALLVLLQDFEKMFMLLFAETLDIFLCVLITGFLIFHLHCEACQIAFTTFVFFFVTKRTSVPL